MITAITLNYNQNDYTSKCALSVLESVGEDIHLVVIDNGSTEDNFRELKSLLPLDDSRLTVHRIVDNIGYVGGVNVGLKIAFEQRNSDYTLVMNNDTIIDSKAITELIQTAKKHDNKAIVSGKVYNYDEQDTLQFIGNGKGKTGLLDFPAFVKNRREKDLGQYDQEMEMGMIDDIFWLIPKLVFDQVGYYSNYFFLYGEQNDYALRAVKAGNKLIYTPNAKIWHKGKVTTADGDSNSPKIEYWRSFAVMKIAVLHFSGADSKKLLSQWKYKRTLKVMIWILTGKSKFSSLKAHLLAIKHFKFWNKVRYVDNGYNPF
ncbi:glycosyltransferase family 2 protein [Phaeocystidibacter marisrubri]|uniref:Glycosyltransferase family 2 protein n=1 Tax=Phaeocystidibacter marisrubri TaxID=1577780 RepID=A0A6L3ZI99_9FLAO|nr:glycosyltransferase family 2 protein [Phaeocystidibacter marisrubri]KAB2817604.1 glycosyltransferase family 2 protein [Phaeocystidibacter marisrubri]GGH74533.1 glycosyl transferase family 2 [Phaeocystidibacter marisrubri]